MSTHKALVAWQRAAGEKFTDKRYSRAHTWTFDGGASIAASASPHVVPLPYSVEANVDPEEAYVAALSSCHMLTFLALAAARGILIETYEDHAEGVMEKNKTGKLAISRVILNPVIAYGGVPPSRALEEELHHKAHEECYLANSVKTEIETHIAERASGG
jgi:organic hydroperoxide reductase OsmC/OhrA